MLRFSLAALLLFGTEAGASLPVAVDGAALPSLAPMLERTTPAVVNISTTSIVREESHSLLSDPFFRRFFDLPSRPRTRRSQSLGSGVIVDADHGLVLTNHHVIENADKITVTLRDGRKRAASVVGSDPEVDIALLRIGEDGLTDVRLADSDALRVGDFVVAIGNPFGLGQTVTSGIVSALGRSGLGIEGFEDFIQTDASINVGNSGGALVNLRGELVGINTAILAPGGGNVGIGFAIPSNMAGSIMAQLLRYGEVRRGQLGIQVQDLTPELARAFDRPLEGGGAVVTRVSRGSPAAGVSVQPGDIVTAINDRPVRSAAAVRNAIGLLSIGERVSMDLLKQGRPKRVVVTVEANQRATAAGEVIHARLHGAELGEIVEGDALYGRIEGVQVLRVESGSRAARVGLKEGDIITSANRKSVDSLDGLREALEDAQALLLRIQRGNSSVVLFLQ